MCWRRRAICGSLETQSKEQQHYALTALPSLWLTMVQVEKTVNLKEWNENSIFNFFTYAEKKKKKEPQINIQQQQQQKNDIPYLIISAEKLAHSWHLHTILSTWLETKFKN